MKNRKNHLIKIILKFPFLSQLNIPFCDMVIFIAVNLSQAVLDTADFL